MDSTKLQAEAIPGIDELGDGVIISSDTRRAERLPPNQVRTKKWPVLDSQGAPEIADGSWKLAVTGLVDAELTFDWEEFRLTTLHARQRCQPFVSHSRRQTSFGIESSSEASGSLFRLA